MRTFVLVLALAACSPTASTDADATTAAPDAAREIPYGERCGNGQDDDGDGLVDEDCVPRLFLGIYAPGVATDPAASTLEAAAGRPLAVLQTYHSLSAAGIARTAPDLAAIFARGQVAHLNVEPSGYSAAQYATPNAAPLAADLSAMAEAIASALGAAPSGRVLLTFGAEMNGNWTDWGCLPAAQFVALYRAFHDRVAAALAARAIDPRRVRWAYGPNATSSASCGSAAGYYPGHAYVDMLGMSAYRAGTESVTTSVMAPMAQLFAALDYPATWQRDRFVVLQTGTRAVAGDDRGGWITALGQTLAADPRVAGLIYFDAADWAVPATGPGWAGLVTTMATAPVADRGLDATFLPHFWDVPFDAPAFAEIQALRDAGITSGCATAPPRFCPDVALAPEDASALLARAFPGGAPATLVAALAAPMTRAEAAIAIARAAKLGPQPLQ